MGKFANWFRSVGRSIEHAAVGVSHFATHIVDEDFSTIKALGTDVVSVAHCAAKGVVSSLSMPIALAAAGIGAMFLLKR